MSSDIGIYGLSSQAVGLALHFANEKLANEKIQELVELLDKMVK